MVKTEKNRKRASIIVLTVFAVILIGLALFIVPLNGKESIPIGKTNYDFYWGATSIRQGLDLKGGMFAEYTADTTGLTNPDSAIEGAVKNLESLLFSKGYSEATVTRQGNNGIRVEVPALTETGELMNLIAKPADLEFRDGDGTVWIKGSKHLEDVGVSQDDGQYVIALQFNSAGKQKFSEATSYVYNTASDKKLYIYIDNKEFMAPTVNGVISDGRAIITSPQYAADYQAASDFAVKLKAGASEVKLNLIRSDTISSSLGQEALMNSIIAAAIGLGLIFLLLVILYRLLGVAASLALLAYVELLMVALAIVPWVQLTLPGIAGVILSIGMAVDANVIIFERIKENKFIGNRAIRSSVQSGFNKALVTILDSNITTILGAIIILIFGSATLKSFALTLLIGVVISFISAVLLTKLLIVNFLNLNDESEVLYGLKAVDAEVAK